MLLLLLGSCRPVAYQSADAKIIAQSHQAIAIAPPRVSIAPNRKIDAQAMKEQQNIESENFQREIYNWVLRRKMQNRMFVEIQDLETTNVRLQEAGYFDGKRMTPAEISEILGVDAVITANLSLSRPISEGAALAIGLLTNFWTRTNDVTMLAEIHDRQDRRVIWSYNRRVTGSVGSTPAQLVNNLMQNASRRMPYTR